MPEILPEHLILPDWPAPPGVRAVSSTRQGGASRPPYDHFNLAGHVGDDPACVAANRQELRATLSAARALAKTGEPAVN